MISKKLNNDLIKEWNWTKNKGLDPHQLTVKAKTYLWWRCHPMQHEWEARLDHRQRGSQCPQCTGRTLAPENNLATNYPDIAKEWHPMKNKITPDKVSKATTKVYWWLCENGHEWPASVSNRTRRGDRCPFDSGKRATPETCLATLLPELAKQWNASKNVDLTPKDVTPQSNKYVWWTCEKGHDWQDKISTRVTGNRCKICFPRKPRKSVSAEYNLKAIHPHLMGEWHPTKNKDSDPVKTSPFSGKKYWWQCQHCLHNWEASVDNRSKGRGCPKCKIGFATSFQEQCLFYYLKRFFPDCQNRYKLSTTAKKTMEVDIYIPTLKIAIEYDGYYYHKDRAKQDEQKNAALKKAGIQLIRIRENNGPKRKLPTIEKAGSHEIQCNADKEQELIRTVNTILAMLNSKLEITVTDLNADRLAIYSLAKRQEKERSLAFLHQTLAEEWHPTKNEELTAWNVVPGSKIRVWWKCRTCSHNWSAIIQKRVNGQPCPCCSGRKASPARSLETEYPIIAAMWHPTKNGTLTPKDVLPGCNDLAWWHCSTCKQEWEEPIHRRSSKKGCPYCNGKRVYEGNCLATKKPSIAKLWHPEKNQELTPFNVTSSSGKLVWWRCKCGNEFEKKIYQMKMYCSKCK